MATKWGDPKTDACKIAQSRAPQWRIDLVMKYTSMLDQSLQITAADRLKLHQQISDYIASLRVCIGMKQSPLMPLLQEFFQEPALDLQNKYDFLAKAFDSEPKVVDGMLAMTDLEYRKLNNFATTHELSSYRSYSNEEVADDNSVRVLKMTSYPLFPRLSCEAACGVFCELMCFLYKIGLMA